VALACPLSVIAMLAVPMPMPVSLSEVASAPVAAKH
jgi:hypothetical protein